MLSRLLRQFLFILIHLVVNLLVTVRNVYRRLCVKKFVSPANEVTKTDIMKILDHVPRMEKRLKHLVMLVDTEHAMSDLAKVVIWSLISGIPYVSFHDITGDLKENEEKLFYEIERNKKGVPGCIKWANKPDLNGYTNGTQANTVVVNIFTYNDGRPKIAQCIKSIALEELSCERSAEEYTAQELNKTLMHVYPFMPDPDLVLYTGSLCCTYGLLPWQIRLTEFIQLCTDHNINVDHYVGALYKYNKCDQRFGT